jgi:hypothetical protein
LAVKSATTPENVSARPTAYDPSGFWYDHSSCPWGPSIICMRLKLSLPTRVSARSSIWASPFSSTYILQEVPTAEHSEQECQNNFKAH